MTASAQLRSQMPLADRPVVLKAENVGMTFETSGHVVEAIRKVDFDLYQGETLAIVGPSGCGKSTLFNAIAGLLPPTRGHVEAAGRRVDNATGHVGYMLQKDLLLPWRTVIDNVVLGLDVRNSPKARSYEIARELIQAYGLAGFENAKPASLSGGMRQRVAIMRTLAFDPQVILLDEPFSALDFQTRLLLQVDVSRIIKERGKSAILVTHDIGEAIAMADRVLVLSARPATVRALHVIDLPRVGRDPVALRTDPAFQAYFARIWGDLEMPPLYSLSRSIFVAFHHGDRSSFYKACQSKTG